MPNQATLELLSSPDLPSFLLDYLQDQSLISQTVPYPALRDYQYRGIFRKRSVSKTPSREAHRQVLIRTGRAANNQQEIAPSCLTILA